MLLSVFLCCRALLLPGAPLPRAPPRTVVRVAASPIATDAGARELVPDVTVSGAATDVKKKLDQPHETGVHVPRVDHVTDWLPETVARQTEYRGGCMVDVQTLEEVLCVVPQPESGIFVDESSVVLAEPVVRVDAASVRGATAYKRGGPRETVYFAAGEVKAAIVTCGGLCPGLNTVVKELVNCLRLQYGVQDVYGIRNGYMGFYAADWQPLALDDVATIHRQGGSLLGSSRGGHDTRKICDAIEAGGVSLVFTIGGDGTMRGAQALAEEFIRRKSKVVVAHVPKTIDNDIPLLDCTFGFGTPPEREDACRAHPDSAAPIPTVCYAAWRWRWQVRRCRRRRAPSTWRATRRSPIPTASASSR